MLGFNGSLAQRRPVFASIADAEAEMVSYHAPYILVLSDGIVQHYVRDPIAGDLTTGDGQSWSRADPFVTERPVASEPQAIAGSDNSAAMSSLRVVQSIDARRPQFASRAEAEGANVPAPVKQIGVISGNRVLNYVRDASGTALTTGDGATWSPAETATFEHWGATGATDDSAAIQAAATAGAVIDGGGKTYNVAQIIALPLARTRWRNLVIDGSDIVTDGSFTTPVVDLTCDAPVEIGALSADGALGANSVTLSATAGLAVGDWVLLSSQKKMAETEVSGDATRHSRACELLRVRSIAGNVVGFWSRTQDSYAVADTAKIMKIQTVAGVDWDGVTIIGADTGLNILDGFESKYRNCSFLNQTTRGVNEDRCYRTDGDGWYFESQATLPAFTEAPYGLSYVACQDCNYGDIRGLRTRHLTTTGSNSASRGRMISRGCSLGNISGIDSFSSVVDQHPGGGFLQVGNVYATFADNATQRNPCQFQGAGGSVMSVETPNGNPLLFDSYGFFQEGFFPLVTIGSMVAPNATTAIVVTNFSNRYGTGAAQEMRFRITAADLRCGVGLTLNPTTGNIAGGVLSGSIQALTALGLGRCFYAATVGGFTATLRNGAVVCSATAGARIVQMDAGSISFSGGSLSGIGGNAEIRLTNAAMRLIGTDEASLTQTLLSGATLLRATMA